MVVDFVHFLVQLIVALTLLRLAQVHFGKTNPNSPAVKALSVIIGS